MLRVIPQLAPRCGAECVSSWYDDDNDKHCVVGVTMLPQLLLVESATAGVEHRSNITPLLENQLDVVSLH